MSWLWLLSFLLLIIIPVIARNQLSKEIDQNEKFPTPEQHQVYWHVRHNREDIKTIYFMIVIGFSVVILLLVLIANKLHVFD
jgi:hypothetical protein